MITNGKVLKWSEPVERAYANATDRIIVNIARHLKSGKEIHTAKWETQKLSEMGQLTAENARIIRDALRQMPKDMKDALDDTAKESLRLVDEAIEEAIRTGAVERSPISSTQGVVDELMQQALDQMNLVNTTMLESSQKAYLKCVNDTVRWETSMLSEQQTQTTLETLNDATVAVLSGGETRTLALRRAIKELNAAGLYGFVDKRGRHWSPEAYVNMCMRTTVHNVAVRSVQARQQDYGSSIFQCSYHPASRPEHYPFQNKFYSWDGTSGTFTDGMGGKHQYESVTVTGYGTAAGLFGINCGHFPLPQIPGVTVPSDPDMQSAETDARQYKESQEQRQLERNIRLSKRLEEAYKAAGDDVGAAEAGMRTRLEQARMREFIDRTGRVRRYDREQISGYGPDKLVRPKKVIPPGGKVFKSGEQANEYFGQRPDRALRRENREEYDRQKEAYESSMFGSWYKNLTGEQTASIGNYTGDAYSGINGFLRGQMTEKMVNSWDALEKIPIKEMIHHIDDAISEFDLKEPIRVFRTCDADVLESLKLNVGGTFRDDGYGSTSVLSKKVASGNIVMQIDVPAGKGNGAWINPLSGAEDEEYEFLLPRGSEFKITGVRQSGEDTVVEMTMTGHTKGEFKFATREEVIERLKKAGVYDQIDTDRI